MSTSVSRALIALKHFQSNVAARIAEGVYAFVSNNGRDISSGKPTQEVQKKTRQDLQSIRDSIEDAFQKRCKINQANNKTVVQVAGRSMTITEALIYRQHTLPQLRALVGELTKQNSGATRLYQSENAKWVALCQNKDTDAIAALAPTFEPSLFNAEEQIKELQEIIRFFDEELDSVLTETNPVLMID